MLLERKVVTCFLRHRGEVLLLRRSQAVGTYRGLWGGVAGHVENDDPDASALREIEEETGLGGSAHLVRRGEAFSVEDTALGRRWIVHPYLFDSDRRDARLDFESVEAEWVSPTEILRRETVPQLWTSYERVAPSLDSIVQDREHGSAYLSLRALEVLRDRAGAGESWERLRALALSLIQARPSMAVLENRIDRVMQEARESASPESVERRAHAAIARAVENDEAAARAASELVAAKRVFTISRSSTVTAALLRVDPPPFVVVAESAPGGEGAITAAELTRSGLQVVLIPDAKIAEAFASFELDCALVGADSILPSGAIVNKTGTRFAALAARESGARLYAVSATDKLSRLETPPLEPLFEVTPHELVSGIASERGLLTPDAVRGLLPGIEALSDWRR